MKSKEELERRLGVEKELYKQALKNFVDSVGKYPDYDFWKHHAEGAATRIDLLETILEVPHGRDQKYILYSRILRKLEEGS
jgi:hypothetical protein